MNIYSVVALEFGVSGFRLVIVFLPETYFHIRDVYNTGVDFIQYFLRLFVLLWLCRGFLRCITLCGKSCTVHEYCNDTKNF